MFNNKGATLRNGHWLKMHCCARVQERGYNVPRASCIRRYCRRVGCDMCINPHYEKGLHHMGRIEMSRGESLLKTLGIAEGDVFRVQQGRYPDLLLRSRDAGETLVLGE